MSFLSPDLLNASWRKYLEIEFSKEYFLKLNRFLQNQKLKNVNIFPPRELIFNALNLTPLVNVKVVILGQDPYHGLHQAHGLAFSVPKNVKFPPSLKNIFQELQNDLAIPIPPQGDLSAWAKEGVLLLNTVLTVEEGKPASHQDFGWEKFTDEIIQLVNLQQKHVVFILWGAHAQKKEGLINQKIHFIIKSVHPSPLSSYRGFFGSKPFSKANSFLSSNGIPPINWKP
jgi:uracil-DNA glycosylase